MPFLKCTYILKMEISNHNTSKILPEWRIEMNEWGWDSKRPSLNAFAVLHRSIYDKTNGTLEEEETAGKAISVCLSVLELDQWIAEKSKFEKNVSSSRHFHKNISLCIKCLSKEFGKIWYQLGSYWCPQG